MSSTDTPGTQVDPSESEGGQTTQVDPSEGSEEVDPSEGGDEVDPSEVGSQG